MPMTSTLRSINPPPGTLFLEGVEVTNLLRTPAQDSYYVTRLNAPTKVLLIEDLANALEVR